jgi:hypothetical protein
MMNKSMQTVRPDLVLALLFGSGSAAGTRMELQGATS